MSSKNRPEDQARYQREYYERNREAVIARAAKNRAAAVERNRAIQLAERSRPCADCGQTFPPVVMQFDHTGSDKEMGISEMVRRPLSEKRLRAEIAKCEVVCANCHIIRTATRAGWK